MSVGDGRDVAPGAEGIAETRDEADWRRAHDAATALALVEGLLRTAEPIELERCETGVARRAPRMELAYVEQPALRAAGEGGVCRRPALRPKPTQVCPMDVSRELGAALHRTGASGEDQTLGGEEGHLGVVRDRSPPAIGRLEVRDPPRPEPLLNGLQRVELHRCTQGISDGSAKQAASGPV
jgi:hypothetical protein